MPLNALMMPTTVPNRPTKGAVEPMVARPERPRFISACTMATERSKPRLAASMTSASGTWLEADWNSESPVATTLAMWLFLLRSAMEMASSSLPSRSAPATCWTKTRDCLRAALYIRTRSIMTPTDHADIKIKRTTTALAGIPIERHMLMTSQPTVWPCRNQRPNNDSLASIRFAPFRSFENCLAGIRCTAHPRQIQNPGAPKHPGGVAAALGTQRKDHVNRGHDFDRLAVQQSRLIAPLLHGIERSLHEQRVAGQHLQLLDRAVFGDHRLQPHSACDAGLPGERRIKRVGTADQFGQLHLAADADALRAFLGRWRPRNTADDAADHASGLPARHAARHAANDGARADIGGHFGFLDNVDFLRNHARGHQLTSLDQPRYGLDHFHGRNGRRRRRRRGRRRGHEQRGQHRLGQRLGVYERNQDQDREDHGLNHRGKTDRPRLVGLLPNRA